MTGRNGTGRPKRLATAVVAGSFLLIPATLAGTGGRLFPPLAAAVAEAGSMPGAGDLLAAARSATAEPDEYGASGNLPDADTLSPELVAALAGPAVPDVPGLSTGAGPLATVPPGALGLPGVMLDAYMRAANTLAATSPRCGLHWSVLAAIGRIESNHARGGAVDAQGITLQPILGPQLSGGPGIAAIPDTDGGALDGDTAWDRAVGPMQFIPGTWARYAVDGNKDGVASPHNIYDATLAAGNYLCAGGGDLRDPVALAKAVFRYNASDAYVANVLSWAAAYATGVTPLPSSPLPSAPAPVLAVGGPAPVTAAPTTTAPDGTTSSTTSASGTTTTAGSSTTTTTATTTTTTTCPTAPPTVPPTTTTTVPPGCETATAPPSSQTSSTDPPAQTQTQSSAASAPSSKMASQSSGQSSGQSSTQSSVQSFAAQSSAAETSAQSSAAPSSSGATSGANSSSTGAASTTTSLPPT